LSEAPSFGEPVVTLDPAARGSIAYRLLAAEIEGRFGLHSRGGGNGRQPGAATAVPGPGGRGYGTVTSVPRGVEEAWPPPVPWAAESTAREER
jgi:hypothetical protein